jgi:hypothetical protein
MLCENRCVSGDPIDHEHVWGVVFLDMVGNNDDQSWVATCRDCGETKRGNDAPRELGITAWTGTAPDDDSDDPNDAP